MTKFKLSKINFFLYLKDTFLNSIFSQFLGISNNLEDCFNKIDELEYYYKYPKGDTQVIIFSGGTRTIEDINDF